MNGAVLAILLVQLLLGLLAGFVMHRADFCFAGMFRDLVLFRRRTMLYALLLLLSAALPLYELTRLLGLTRYPFPLFAPPSVSNLLGGLLFGVGMVLAGGCVAGSLYRAGAGNTLSATALCGLVLGSLLYVELDAWWLSTAPLLRFATSAITLPQLLGVPPWVALLPVFGCMLPLIIRWWRQGKLKVTYGPEGHIQPWQAALILAAVAVLSTVVAGLPMGVTTSYAKLGGYLLLVISPEHFESLAYFKRESLKLVHPLFGVTLTGGGAPRLDGIALVQFPLMAGLIVGGGVSALLLREFQIHFKAPARHYLSALCGGILMGLASRLGPSCNIWHLTGGLPILSLQSILFVVGLLPGAWLGTKLLTGYVTRSG